MNQLNVTQAFLNFCTVNGIEVSQCSYDDFSVSRCTSCGTLRDELNTPCKHCGSDQGEGFSFCEIWDEVSIGVKELINKKFKEKKR